MMFLGIRLDEDSPSCSDTAKNGLAAAMATSKEFRNCFKYDHRTGSRMKRFFHAFDGLMKITGALGMTLLLFGVVIFVLSSLAGKPGIPAGVMQIASGALLTFSSFVGMWLAKLLGYSEEEDDSNDGDSVKPE
jgi:hypothetical protein